MYHLVEQLTQLCDFTYVAYDSVFSNCLRSEWHVSRICVPDLVDVTGRTILIPSSDVLGTKEPSWQGRVPYKGHWRRGSVCFRQQFERRSHGGVAPLSVRKQVSEWRRFVPQQGRNVISSSVRAQSGAFKVVFVHTVCWRYSLRTLNFTYFEQYSRYRTRFLGAFTNLLRATVSFVTAVRPSALKNSVPNRLIFMKFENWVFFENLSRGLKIFN